MEELDDQAALLLTRGESEGDNPVEAELLHCVEEHALQLVPQGGTESPRHLCHFRLLSGEVERLRQEDADKLLPELQVQILAVRLGHLVQAQAAEEIGR